MNDFRAFAAVAFRRPLVTGTVAPTSAELAGEVAAIVPTQQPATVIELGPGTGVISDAIRERLLPGSRHIAVEIEDDLVRHLRATRPWLEVVHGDATELDVILKDAEIDEVDAVVTSLPWTLLSADQQQGLLDEMSRALRPEGAFSAISVLNPRRQRMRAFRERLESTFDEVLVTKTTWRNLPPARSYICHRPHPPDT